MLHCKPDYQLFLRGFVIFNVILALFNIFTFRFGNQERMPCMVVVSPNGTTSVLPNSSWLPRWLLGAGSWNSDPTGVPPVIPGLEGGRWTWEIRMNKFLVIKNYVPADGDAPQELGVTFTTQATHEFLPHVQEVCKRWDGPVSLAVYAPGSDLALAIRQVLYWRQCGHPCVRTNVSWHLVYDLLYGPPVDSLQSPEKEAAVIIDCSVEPKPAPTTDFRRERKLPYPINVLRNVARLQARTRYVLPSDVELYPCADLVPRFLRLVAAEAENPTRASAGPHVYVLPLFEVKSNLEVPATKAEVVALVTRGDAVFFHKWVCDVCQKFPRREDWLKQVPANDSLGVFHITKRERFRSSWEPIYIGTNAEPLYDERLSWEGKKDKMSQMYEMCLMDYNLFILDNAFLVHAPGIKRVDQHDHRRRLPYVRQNDAIHGRLINDLQKKYGHRHQC